ncbi:hypothetical protein QE320_gp143 [Pseudomonas phage EM]|uniref:Uncharacterized protein n=1 Tax=Pseudomonas phage EM TaxID=2936914 RepID=A0AAE9HJI4_9CAUD|nr:hypothetical protein QE320_gp143 [Pseudomonas phage EM]UPW35911.1 hypothetical protein EM_126 [Pseudomonas phage EM]
MKSCSRTSEWQGRHTNLPLTGRSKRPSALS